MGNHAIDMTGQRFGRLKVLHRDGSRYDGATWRCRCDCGNEATFSRQQLVVGRRDNCGCLDEPAVLGMRGMDKDESAANAVIGRNIRLARKAARMSQGRLGEALGLSYQQVHKFESGKNRISAARLVEIADILGENLTMLYRGVWSRWNGWNGERVDGGVDFGGSRPVAIPPEFLETFEQDEDAGPADEGGGDDGA